MFPLYLKATKQSVLQKQLNTDQQNFSIRNTEDANFTQFKGMQKVSHSFCLIHDLKPELWW